MPEENTADLMSGERPVRSLLRLYRGQRVRLAVASVAFTAKHAPVWVMPVLTADVIDVVVQHRPLRDLWLAAGLMGLLVVLNLPLAIVYVRQASVAIRTVETELRAALSRRLQELSIGYHRRVSAGVLQAKVVRDVENVVEASRQVFDSGLAATTTLVGAVVLTAVRVPEFLPVLALAVPAAAALVGSMRRTMQRRNAMFRSEVERMAAKVSEMTHLIPVTRAHALEDSELERVGAALSGVRDAGLRLDVVNGRFGAASWISLQMLSIACLVGGAWLAWSGRFGISAGDVVMLTGYFASLTGAVTQLVNLAPVLTRGLESVRSIGEVLGEQDVERNQGKADVRDVRGEFVFDDVTFSYPESSGLPAVDRLSLHIEQGETLAFVGASGSGKSTVLNLVVGFLAPTSGRLLLDGRDMAEIDLRSYRRRLAVVPQEPLLFEGTVRDNVTYGREDIADNAVVAALVDANAWAFVKEMGGLDGVVGQRGASLSGGQRQRLAIARALVRDPRVLVLDEATSALDGDSERLVQEALARLVAGRTTIVVAHRLATIRDADRIAVLRHGELVEIGPHAELAAAGGHYAELMRLGTPFSADPGPASSRALPSSGDS